MDLQAVTGKLYIKDGVVQPLTAESLVPGILVQPAPPKPARGRNQDFLFLHLSLSGPAEGAAVLYTDLLDVVVDTFYATGGSTTAAMRGALMKLNDLLLRHNLHGGGASREGAITMAVLRRGELFTLQVGESIALLGHNYGVERLPPRREQLVSPLGRSTGIDIRYYHHRLQVGDMLLLADPRLSHLPTESFNQALVNTHVEYGLEKCAAIIGEDSARLLLIEFSDEAPINLPEATGRPRLGGFVAPKPQPRRDPDEQPLVNRPERRPQPELPVSSPRRAIDFDMDTVEHTARRAGSQTLQGASRFTAWLADLLARIRPPREPDAEAPEGIGFGWAVTIAVGIPILLAVIVSGVYMERGRVQQLADIRVDMAENITLAESTEENSALARQYYQTALALAEIAESEVRPGDSEVLRLREKARLQLDLLDGVTRLNARALYTFSEGTQLTEVVLRDGEDGGIFTLDQGHGLVYEHDTDETYTTMLNDQPRQIVFSGQAVNNHVVGNVIDMFWRPLGTAVRRAGLAMLDNTGALITYQPSLASSFAVPLDLASTWQAPLAVTTFDERLYILDISRQMILKYYPEGENFTVLENEQQLLFAENADLQLVVDLDIYSADGSLLLVYRDGRVRYYDTQAIPIRRLLWDENVLLNRGMNSPLVAPNSGAIIGNDLNASVFIGDPGSGRIVQISRPTGQVINQFRITGPDGSELLSEMTSFTVRERPLRLFITTADTLYLATTD